LRHDGYHREIPSRPLGERKSGTTEDEVFDAGTFAERFKRLPPHADGPHMVIGRHVLQEDSARTLPH
jgi:hypothetical protein